MDNQQIEVLNREDDINKVNRIANTQMVFCLLKTVPFVLMLIIFAVPFINVNLILGEVNVSMFNLIFASGDSVTAKGIISSGLMADFFGMGENYKNIFDGVFNALAVNNLGDGSNFLQIIKVLFVDFFLTLASIFTFMTVTIVSLITGINSIFKRNVEWAMRSVDDQTFEEIFYPERKGERNYNKDFHHWAGRMAERISKSMIKYYILTAFCWLFTLGLYLYFPLKLIIFLMKYPLITVSIWFIVFCLLFLLVSCVFTVVEFFYSNNNAIILWKGRTAKTIMKNIGKY